jgi:predicted O-methyltransferase YrrM
MALTQVVRRVRGMGAALTRPPYVPPGHFYSPATDFKDRERAVTWRNTVPAGVDLREAEQTELAQKLAPLMSDLREDRWQLVNGMYGRSDASVLHAMLRHHRPRHLVEVGSGYSTAVVLDTVERYLPELHVTCIEPYPDRLWSLMRPGDEVDLIRRPVQDVPVDVFAELRDGDVLLIDSTHVVKPGSDVVYLYLHVLPLLAPGVIVHVHDIHWPWEYPERWLREGRDWTEIYLLRAFLTHNKAWRILLFTSWLWTLHPEMVPDHLRGQPTGALWMQRM